MGTVHSQTLPSGERYADFNPICPAVSRGLPPFILFDILPRDDMRISEV